VPYAVASHLWPRTGTEQTVFQVPYGCIRTSQALSGLFGPVLALKFLLFGALSGVLALFYLVVCLLEHPGRQGRSLAVQPVPAPCVLLSTYSSSLLAPLAFPARPITPWVALSIFLPIVFVHSLGSLELAAVAAAGTVFEYGSASELLCKRL
jgi:hypothetical protein